MKTTIDYDGKLKISGEELAVNECALAYECGLLMMKGEIDDLLEIIFIRDCQQGKINELAFVSRPIAATLIAREFALLVERA